eukprot:89249_1
MASFVLLLWILSTSFCLPLLNGLQKGVGNELKIKRFDSGPSWENKVISVLEFINSKEIENICQLVDILTAISGEILIYYWNKSPSNKETTVNSPILQCKTHRHNDQNYLELAEVIKKNVTEQELKQTLFKVDFSIQGDKYNKYPISFIWHWDIKPLYAKDIDSCDVNERKNSIYDETDHILRNYGNNVATIDKGCYFSKGVGYPMNIFQNGYNVETYSYIGTNQVMQINFDRAYILNTFRFLLYDADDRVYKYKIDISMDESSWKTIAN